MQRPSVDRVHSRDHVACAPYEATFIFEKRIHGIFNLYGGPKRQDWGKLSNLFFSECRQMTSETLPRDTMRSLPSWTQPFWSWLTAKPLIEQLESRQAKTPLYHIAVSAGLFVVGVAISAFGVAHGLYGLLPFGFVLATAGAKQFQVMICHQAVHDMVLNGRRSNEILGTVISSVLMLKPFKTYKSEHVHHHDHQSLLTDLDDTLRFLRGNVGLRTSDTVGEMWTKLVLHAFSPMAMAQSIWGRVTANLLQTNCRLAALTIGGWGLVIAASIWVGGLHIFLLAYALPVFVGYHICSTFRLAAEHTWPPVEVLRARGISFIAESTTGVFIGEPLEIPNEAGTFRRLALTSAWLMRMLSYHLFIRLFVMVGDTPCHDFHHRRPRSREWPNYVTAREADRLKGSKPFPSNYLDFWGYGTAVTNNFRSFQMAADYYDQIEAQESLSPATDNREIFA